MDPPTEPVTVRIESLGGRPVVTTSINGGGAYPFIFDTGASGSVIGRPLADELKLPVIGKSRVGRPVGDRVTEADVVRIDRLQIGGLRVDGVTATVLDLPDVGSGGGFRGVLSPAALPGVLVTVDFPAQQLILRPGHLDAPDDRNVFEYSADTRLPTVPVTVAGQRLRLHVDSGSPGFITVADRLAAALPLQSKPVSAGRARTAGGEVELTEAPLDGDVQVGERVIPKPKIRFINTRGDGNLGSAFIRDYVVTLDHDHRRIKLEHRPGK